MDRTYDALRQEVKRDLERLYPGSVIITLYQAMKIYGYKDRGSCLEAMKNVPRVASERRVCYYIGDIASDIARRRYAGVKA